MLKILIYLLIKARNFLNKLVNLLQPDCTDNSQKQRVISWFKDNGDKTHRLNYNLSNTSTVFDLGGYEGQWASDIYSMYNCKVYVFEPVISYVQYIQNRFKLNPNVIAYPFGLSNATTKLAISIEDDASSTYKVSGNTTEIDLVKIEDFLSEQLITKIDLIKINIEGGEFDLLQHLIDINLIGLFENIQVQFHDFVPNASEKMKKIQEDLSKTHLLTYQYEFVWENWKLKNASS